MLSQGLKRVSKLITSHHVFSKTPFSSTTISRARDPASDLMDIMEPSPKRASTPPKRSPDVRSPFDQTQGYPDSRGRVTTSVTTPDTTTPDFPPNSQPSDSASSTTDDMVNTLRKFMDSSAKAQSRPSPDTTRSIQDRRPSGAGLKRSEEYTRNIENQMIRRFRHGDVYAPNDMSPAQQRKAKRANSNVGRQSHKPLNSRRKGTLDMLDELKINPIKEYKNYAMMAEFTSEMGRIKHSRETGYRAVNQRKMAKAVRRAIGIGILPSVHRHPELLPERMEQRGQILRK